MPNQTISPGPDKLGESKKEKTMKVTFEQAWNIRAAGCASCNAITAAQAARGEIPEGNNAARLIAASLRHRMKYGGLRLREVVSQAVYENACTASSGKIFALARKYEKRNAL